MYDNTMSKKLKPPLHIPLTETKGWECAELPFRLRETPRVQGNFLAPSHSLVEFAMDAARWACYGQSQLGRHRSTIHTPGHKSNFFVDNICTPNILIYWLILQPHRTFVNYPDWTYHQHLAMHMHAYLSESHKGHSFWLVKFIISVPPISGEYLCMLHATTSLVSRLIL
jgi:hypothetical protein